MAYAEDVRVTGVLANTGDVVKVNYPTMATVTFQLVGTANISFIFEANNDEGSSPTFVPLAALNLSTGQISSTATASGIYRVDASACRVVRVRALNAASGSYAVTCNASVASASAVAGNSAVPVTTTDAGGNTAFPATDTSVRELRGVLEEMLIELRTIRQNTNTELGSMTSGIPDFTTGA